MKCKIFVFVVLACIVGVIKAQLDLPNASPTCSNTTFSISQGRTTYFEINPVTHQTTIENSLLCLEPEETRPACTAENQGCLEYYTKGSSGPEVQICTLRQDTDVDFEFDNGTYQWQSLTPELELLNDFYVLGTDNETINSGAPVALDDSSFIPRSPYIRVVDTETGNSILDNPTVVIGIDGNPIVAYIHHVGTSFESSFNYRYYLNLLFCKDPYCQDPSARTVTIEHPHRDRLVSYLSMVIDPTGVPVITAYSISGEFGLKKATLPFLVGELAFIRCSDRFCSNNTITFPSRKFQMTNMEEFAGVFSSVVIASNGFPFITYGAAFDEVYFAQQCYDANCHTYSDPTTSTFGEDGFTLLALTVEMSPQTRFPVITTIAADGGAGDSTTSVVFCGDLNCTTANSYTFTDGGSFGLTSLDTSVADNGDIIVYAVSSYYDNGNDYNNFGIFYCSAIDGPNSATCAPAGATEPNNVVDDEETYDLAITVDGKGYPAQATYLSGFNTNTRRPFLEIGYSLCSDPFCTAVDIITAVDRFEYFPRSQEGVTEFTRQISMTTGIYGYPVIAYVAFQGGKKEIRLISLSNRFGTPYFKR